MKLMFLGTGNAFSDFRENYYNNAVVHTEDGPVLIDCGDTAHQSMLELGIKPWDIHAVIITHMHGDHIGGLERLIWERMYTGPTGMPGFLRTKIITEKSIKKMLKEYLEPCIGVYTDPRGKHRSTGVQDLIEIHELSLANVRRTNLWYLPRLCGLDIGALSFALYRTPHIVDHSAGVDKPCFGVRIMERGGEEIYFTSDTTFRPAIGDLFPQAKLIFHDCTFSPKYPNTVHTHYEDLKTLPDEVRAKTVLMHHHKVPEGIDVREDGFFGAANRHQIFEV